jgi:hypothetical protein
VYIQLMKQLTENLSLTSEGKGWEMFALMLSCFPPPETVENFVAMFLRKNVGAAADMHQSVSAIIGFMLCLKLNMLTIIVAFVSTCSIC